MIAELQNQDPLNPLNNDELIQQFGQIRQVGATEKLTSTLDSVLLGQNIASATNLIGAEVDGISDDGQSVTGMVERVSVAGGQPKLHLDLRPRATASTKDGDMEAGDYEYRVVWEQGGVQFGIDPLATGDGKSHAIRIQGRAGVDQAVQLSNLPATTATRRVYRREAGDEQFRLVGTITDNKAATFLDTKAKDRGDDCARGIVPGGNLATRVRGQLEKRRGDSAAGDNARTLPDDSDDEDGSDDETDRADYRPADRPTFPSSDSAST